MNFPDKLTEIMRTRGIYAQDIAKQSRGNITISDVRRFQKGACPTSYQVMFLNNIFGIDFELIISPPDKPQEPVRQLGISISEFGKVEEIGKPGAVIKSSKIKNSITRIHKIPIDGLICSNCDNEDESCVPCHPEDSIVKMRFGGRGISEKLPDEMVAMLCLSCRSIMDVKPDKDDQKIVHLYHTIQWQNAIIVTQARRIAMLENKK